MTLKLSDRVKQSDTIMTGEENGQTVMMDIVNGGYIQLDPIGAAIWSEIETEKTITEVRDAMLARYNVDEETCTKHCLAFLTELAGGGAVIVSSE